MNSLLQEAERRLYPLGFRKRGRAFRRLVEGFHQVVKFQHGAHGSYFFVNLGVHPVELPQVVAGPVVVAQAPRVQDCLLVQRIEDVSRHSGAAMFLNGYVQHADVEAVGGVLEAVVSEGVPWLQGWSSWERLLRAEHDSLTRMMPIAPIIKARALAMLRYYAALNGGCFDEAAGFLEAFRQAGPDHLDYGPLEQHLAAGLADRRRQA